MKPFNADEYSYLDSLNNTPENNSLRVLKSFGKQFIPKPIEVPQYPMISQVPDNGLQSFVPRPLDYDMQGYHNKYGYPSKAEGEHYTDEFKLPNHPTFSDQSMYSQDSMKGGHWEELQKKPNVVPYAPTPQEYNFIPSQQNIQNKGIDALTQYFQRYENKGTNLKLPNKTVFGGIHKYMFQ